MGEDLVKKTENNCNLPGPGPGRPKGSKNKFTGLKEAFLEAFEEMGGAEGLLTWIKKSPRNQSQFYQLISKMLPSNLSVEGDINVVYQISDKLLPKLGNDIQPESTSKP